MPNGEFNEQTLLENENLLVKITETTNNKSRKPRRWITVQASYDTVEKVISAIDSIAVWLLEDHGIEFAVKESQVNRTHDN